MTFVCVAMHMLQKNAHAQKNTPLATFLSTNLCARVLIQAYQRRYNSNDSHYMGRVMNFAGDESRPFISGGSGEVLSRQAVNRLGEALHAEVFATSSDATDTAAANTNKSNGTPNPKTYSRQYNVALHVFLTFHFTLSDHDESA